MLSRLSLRLRVFLIFAGLAVGLNAVIGAALLVAWRRLDQAGHALAFVLFGAVMVRAVRRGR